METAYINIGTNRGDRRANLARAVVLIRDLAEGSLRLSDIVESAPWGFDSPHPFLNLGAAFPTSLSPLDLLHRLQEIESAVSPDPHRWPDGTYRDRIIDIDLLALGRLVVDTPELTLPHPRMHLREFVLQPMAQLAPSWLHPLLHLSPAALLTRL